MLHILLLILKIIGIILAVILGILVLLSAILIFVPVRYKVLADCQGSLDSLKAKIKISWFLHLISVELEYMERQFRWRARVAFKHLDPEQRKEPPAESAVEILEEATPEPIQDVIETAKVTATSVKDEGQEAVRETEEDFADIKEEPKATGEEKEETEDPKKSGIVALIKKVYEKIKTFFEKIKYTLKKICDTISMLLEKKEKIVALLTDDTHQKALRKLKKEALRLLKHLKPKRFKAELVFGFKDPYRTGQALAGYSMLYPFIGNNAIITPDFEHQVLKGTLYVKGRIRALYFLVFCWNMFWNRSVRRTYKDIRAFKL